MTTSSTQKTRQYQTLGYDAVFIALGLIYVCLGPTLQALAEQTGVGLKSISYVISAQALGYLLGAQVGGRLYDIMRGHRLMAVMLLSGALMMVLIPLVSSLWLLVAVVLLLGAFLGAVDVGGNTLLVWVHGNKVGPYMNALHFFFGVGASISPLLITQVVAWSGGIRWAYWLLAGLAVPVVLGLSRLPSPELPATASAAQNTPSRARAAHPALLIFLIALFFFLYVGAESSFGSWTATYVQALGIGGEAMGRYMTALFWGALTLGRLLAIPMATRFSPQQMLYGDLLVCFVSVLLLVLWPAMPVLVWLGTFGAGLAMASMFPAMLSFAERRMTITGKTTAWFFVGSSLGGMTLPWVIGQLFESVGPRVTVVAILINIVMALAVFFALGWVTRRRKAAR